MTAMNILPRSRPNPRWFSMEHFMRSNHRHLRRNILLWPARRDQSSQSCPRQWQSNINPTITPLCALSGVRGLNRSQTTTTRSPCRRTTRKVPTFRRSKDFVTPLQPKPRQASLYHAGSRGDCNRRSAAPVQPHKNPLIDRPSLAVSQRQRVDTPTTSMHGPPVNTTKASRWAQLHHHLCVDRDQRLRGLRLRREAESAQRQAGLPRRHRPGPSGVAACNSQLVRATGKRAISAALKVARQLETTTSQHDLWHSKTCGRLQMLCLRSSAASRPAPRPGV